MTSPTRSRKKQGGSKFMFLQQSPHENYLPKTCPHNLRTSRYTLPPKSSQHFTVVPPWGPGFSSQRAITGHSNNIQTIDTEKMYKTTTA
jgi:hypothetical protein